MGWSIGYDENHKRDVGYGVPAYCDQPGCQTEIDRGLAHTCGGEPFGGDDGCGLHFCGDHLSFSPQVCQQCLHGNEPFALKPDHPDWLHWKLTDESWQHWRDENPEVVERLRVALINCPAAQEGEGREKFEAWLEKHSPNTNRSRLANGAYEAERVEQHWQEWLRSESAQPALEAPGAKK